MVRHLRAALDGLDGALVAPAGEDGRLRLLHEAHARPQLDDADLHPLDG
jgi:hypothetical protein